MNFINELASNNTFIVLASISSIISLAITLFVASKVININKFIDKSKNLDQKNTFGDNEGTIN